MPPSPRDSLALSAAPPNALLLWTDGRDLYTELPGPAGLHVIRYPLTQAGLSSALGLIRKHAYDGANATATAIHLTPPAPRSGTIAQQQNARAVLRRLRILP